MKSKIIHIARLSGGIFCGAKHIDILNTVIYTERDKCTCLNCLKVVKRLQRVK